MNWSSIALASLVVVVPARALSEKMPIPPARLPVVIEVQGSALKVALKPVAGLTLGGIDRDLPVTELLRVALLPARNATANYRSAKDAEIYRTASPSVVMVVTKNGRGSGSLVSLSGEILTNWHVVAGCDAVAIVFKPAMEGARPGPGDMTLGRVVKYDQLADLALVKVEEVPSGRVPIRLGDAGEIVVGADVSAIGHPKDNDWSLTTGIISQYRRGYEWRYDDSSQHKADVIQTQTPINPGNSGGPLISESGTLIGVNTLKAEGGGEGINFAVSVDDVRRFLASTGGSSPGPPKSDCAPKEILIFRNKDNDAGVIAYDLDCSGRPDADYIVPDRKTDPIMLTWDRKGSGRPDVIYFDFKRRGRWDLSYWDAKFEGKWTVVGYHDDGTLRPARFESYEDYQKRLVPQR